MWQSKIIQTKEGKMRDSKNIFPDSDPNLKDLESLKVDSVSEEEILLDKEEEPEIKPELEN